MGHLPIGKMAFVGHYGVMDKDGGKERNEMH